MGAGVDAVPDADAGLAGCVGEGLDRGAGLGGDVLEAALAVLVLLAEPVRVGAAAGGGAGWQSPALVRSCLMACSLHPVMRAILRAPYPWLVRSRSWSSPGGSGSARGGAGLPAASWGAGWRAAVSRTWSAVVASRAAMARTGRPERMSGCRSSGLMPSGSGPGQVMPAAQANGGSQVTGSRTPAWASSARACWCRQRAIGPGRVNTNSAAPDPRPVSRTWAAGPGPPRRHGRSAHGNGLWWCGYGPPPGTPSTASARSGPRSPAANPPPPAPPRSPPARPHPDTGAPPDTSRWLSPRQPGGTTPPPSDAAARTGPPPPATDQSPKLLPHHPRHTPPARLQPHHGS